jgi:hypothetical protein
LSLIAQSRVNEFVVLNAGVAGGLQHQGIGSRVDATFAW